MVVKQIPLVPGTHDNRKDCMGCSAYSPNGEAVFRCRFDDEPEVHKCEHCGYCTAFRPITDDDANSWLIDDRDNGSIKKTTFNRWRWIEP